MLSDEDLKKRDGKITASMVPTLMMGSDEQLLNYWRELVGDPNFKRDPSGWYAKVGHALEPLILDDYEEKNGRKVTRRGEVVQHPALTYFCCTLDGFDGMPLEAKFMGPFRDLDERVGWYTWQVLAQMECTKTAEGRLLISKGGLEPKEFAVKYTQALNDIMMARIAAFWQCVQSMTPPVHMPEERPPAPERLRQLDMTGNNLWASCAKIWLMTKDQAKAFKDVVEEIKAIVPHDVGHAFGYGIQIKRAKNNSLTISEGDR